jgi:hypothetical protein
MATVFKWWGVVVGVLIGGTAPSEMPLPFPDAKKTTVPKVAQTKDNKQKISAVPGLWMATVFKWWGVVVGVLIGESSPLRRS